MWFSGLIGLGISLLALVALYQYLAEDTTTLGSEYEKNVLTVYWKHMEAQLQAISFACQDTVILLPKDDHDQVVFGYQIKGNKCFVLGDPIGNPKMMRAATNQFMKRADCLGYQLAFIRYQKAT